MEKNIVFQVDIIHNGKTNSHYEVKRNQKHFITKFKIF